MRSWKLHSSQFDLAKSRTRFAGQEVSDMMCSVMMMSSAEDELVFKTGLEVVPLGVVPDPAGAPELVVEGTDPAEAPELEVEGTVEPVGAGVSPPAEEGSTKSWQYCAKAQEWWTERVNARGHKFRKSSSSSRESRKAHNL
jgi:hypothetical protein